MATEESKVSRNFLSRYHASAVCALPEDEVEKFRIRLGANLFQPFVDSLPEEQLSLPELKTRLEAYIRDELEMADQATVEAADGELSVELRGCHLCFGNDLLRAKEMKGCCPFAPGMNRALAKATGGSARLLGVDKPTGVTGECTIRYQIG